MQQEGKPRFLKYHQGSVRGVAYSPKVGIRIFKHKYTVDNIIVTGIFYSPALHLFCMVVKLVLLLRDKQGLRVCDSKVLVKRNEVTVVQRKLHKKRTSVGCTPHLIYWGLSKKQKNKNYVKNRFWQ
jgi:hypothetical protein